MEGADLGDEAEGDVALPLAAASTTSFLSVARGLTDRLVPAEVTLPLSEWLHSGAIPAVDAVRGLTLLARSDWGMQQPTSSRCADSFGLTTDHDYFLSVHLSATLTEEDIARCTHRGVVKLRVADDAAVRDGRPASLTLSRPSAGVTSVEGAAASAIPRFRCVAPRSVSRGCCEWMASSRHPSPSSPSPLPLSAVAERVAAAGGADDEDDEDEGDGEGVLLDADAAAHAGAVR
jgi:hypothetical protein